MTAEKLHDAISLLPADLITEADKRRCAPRPVIRWQRYAAMAACFALMFFGSVWCLHNLGLGGAKETAAEAPAAMQAQMSMDAAEAAPMETQAAAKAAPKEEAAAGEIPSQSGEAVQGSNSTACYASPPNIVLYVDGIAYELEGEDRSTVAGLLLKLDYRKELVCECIAEITILAGERKYSLNLEEGFVRDPEGQANLTDAQILSLKQIVGSLINGT